MGKSGYFFTFAHHTALITEKANELMIKKIVITLWTLVAILLLVCTGIFIFIAKGWIGYMPPVESLENPNYKFATEVFSADGKVLGTYSFSKENRVYVGYDELSPNIINALIATEDVRFARHSGIDAKALFRAILKRGILMQKNAGGGSTITQQLSKQRFSPRADNVMERLFQKPIEWVIAVKLERYYTKEEILTMYLNKFDFLNNAVGIKTASNTYFGCQPSELKPEEAATLVGMCKNPSLYNPLRYNERSRGRRNVVLDQMCKAHYITQAECDSLKALPLKLDYHRVDHKEGLATYFREYLRGVLGAKEPVKKNYRGWQMQQYYEDSLDWATNPLYGWCAKNKKKDGKPYNLYTDGLKIYTTIDSRMQRYAEEAVAEQAVSEEVLHHPAAGVDPLGVAQLLRAVAAQVLFLHMAVHIAAIHKGNLILTTIFTFHKSIPPIQWNVCPAGVSRCVLSDSVPFGGA